MLKMLGGGPLGVRDTDAVMRALSVDPVTTCMVASRVEAYGLGFRALGGQLWTASTPEESLCFSGINLIPLSGDRDHLDHFAERAIATPRLCSSLVGPADLVLPLWERLADRWGNPRELRDSQPMLVLDGPPTVAADPLVQPIGLADLDRYLPAAIEMFRGEIGMDPCAGDGGRAYRTRVAALISARRVFARFDGDTVVFKAEVGALSRRVGQIQGVWVDPEWRGQGIGAAGTATVASAIAAQGRIPSLYVNSFNSSARSAYRNAGFTQVGTFATVLID